MELIKCVECGKELSLSAKCCTSCGSKKPFKGVTLSKQEQKGMSGRERRSFVKAGGKLKLSLFQKIFLLVLVVFFVSWYVAPSKPLTPEEQAAKELQETKKLARYTCQYQLEKHLYVPDSLEYIDAPDDRVVLNKGSNHWFVHLNYKAKNKLGVLLQGQVQCNVVQNGKELSDFSVIDINIQ